MTASGPLIVACLTHADLRPDVDALSGEATWDELAASPSPSELAALEYALTIAASWGGRVLAVVAGPPGAVATLRQAASVGAAALRVPWAAVTTDELGDPQPVARALARAIIAAGAPAVVICGDRSQHRGSGAIPALLAHELGAAQALGLVHLSADTGPVAGTAVRSLFGERRLDGGWRERLRIPTPAVVSVEAGGVRLRRASLPASVAATRAPVPAAPATAVLAAGVRLGAPAPYRPRPQVVPAPAGSDPRQRLLELTGALAPIEAPTVIGPLEPEAAADAILAFLAAHGYIEADST